MVLDIGGQLETVLPIFRNRFKIPAHIILESGSPKPFKFQTHLKIIEVREKAFLFRTVDFKKTNLELPTSDMLPLDREYYCKLPRELRKKTGIKNRHYVSTKKVSKGLYLVTDRTDHYKLAKWISGSRMVAH